jgi:hypothetical protein
LFLVFHSDVNFVNLELRGPALCNARIFGRQDSEDNSVFSQQMHAHTISSVEPLQQFSVLAVVHSAVGQRPVHIHA